MPCQLKTFSHYIDSLLEPAAFQDVAINGIQVQGKKTIRHLATAVTASLNSIRKAVEIGADCLLVHHGLFLKGKDVVIAASLKNCLALLLAYDITLIAHHLPLDAHRELGNNWAAAKLLGWTELEPFGHHLGMVIGVKGIVPSKSRATFQKELEYFYGQKAQCVLSGPKVIKSAALISGGAHKWITEAVDNEVDCFVTGTTDEPIWHIAHQDKINFFALGHYATEQIGVQLLGNYLAEEFSLQHTFIREMNPF